MADYLAVVQRIIEEHQAIRHSVKLVGDTVSDRESLAALGQVRSGWVPGRADILREKHQKLQQTLASLVQGLQNHFHYEEEYLPPVLGEFLMRALLLEHADIKKGLAQVEQALADTPVEGLTQEQVLSAELRLQQAVNSAMHTIEDHAFREEVILNMAQRGLEGK